MALSTLLFSTGCTITVVQVEKSQVGFSPALNIPPAYYPPPINQLLDQR